MDIFEQLLSLQGPYKLKDDYQTQMWRNKICIQLFAKLSYPLFCDIGKFINVMMELFREKFPNGVSCVKDDLINNHVAMEMEMQLAQTKSELSLPDPYPLDNTASFQQNAASFQENAASFQENAASFQEIKNQNNRWRSHTSEKQLVEKFSTLLPKPSHSFLPLMHQTSYKTKNERKNTKKM